MCKELSDQEVWLSIYCAEVSRNVSPPIISSLVKAANDGLKEFRKLFPEKVNTLPPKPPRPPTPPGPRKVS